MRLPLSLIKSFIHLDLSVEKIEETLSLLGLEVDAIQSPKPPFSRVIVAEVKKAERHPNAEKLRVAEVSDGARTHQIVCGAPNCRPGIRVALAQVGAILTDAHGKQLAIEKTSIRGVESLGMLCSATELGLWDDHSGILELPEEFPLGADCVELLWDPVFEISLTPNLGHCMSAFGIARELSAALQKPIRRLPAHLKETSGVDIDRKIEVSVRDADSCPRYTARLIERVQVGPSPFWLQKQLRMAGVRPINNVVDATNYMLLKYGQPMHAFDARKIEGRTIEIALSETAQSFDGLDGQSRQVPAGTLLISDSAKTLALAGILGGASSAVSESTQEVLLEAAAFDPMIIRAASKKMGLRTDSSYRFEKGVDPSAVAEYLDEAAALIAELSKGAIAKGRIDAASKAFAPQILHCRTERANKLLGTQLSEGEIESIFHRLGFAAQKEGGRLRVEVPLFRNDILEEIDLVEEIARIYGYNNIERPLAKSTTPQIPHDPAYLFESELRRRLIALGLQEWITCDLISPKLSELIPEASLGKGSLLQTLHSKSEEYSILRPSLLPGLLQVVRRNLDQKNETLAAFELGRIHFMQGGKPAEFPMIALVLTGKQRPAHWDRKPADADYFDVKGLVENLLDGIRVQSYSFVPSNHISFHPSRQADLFLDSLFVGTIGELHPNLLAKLGIEEKVFYAELNAQSIQERRSPPPHMKPLPQFPSSERDWTISLEPKAKIESIFEAIRSLKQPLLADISLIDLFRAPEKVNATLRFSYRDSSKTLSFEEVEAAHAHLCAAVTEKIGL